MKLLAAVAATILASTASAATLNFSGPACEGGVVCTNGLQVDQSYGDGVNIDVAYDADLGTVGLQPVFAWTTGYESFANAIWSSSTQPLSVFLLPTAGFEVVLTYVGIAPYLNRFSNTAIKIIDLASSTTLFEQTYQPISIAGITDVVGPWSSAGGLEIRFGPDSFNSGIGEIRFDVREATHGDPVVPLPAAGWLLVAALAGMTALRRTRA